MGALRIIAVVLAGSSVVFGIISLLAACFAPKLLASPFMRWMTTGRRLAPDRENQTIMAVWAILLGAYIILATTGHTRLGLAVFVAWLPFGVVVLRRTYWPASRA